LNKTALDNYCTQRLRSLRFCNCRRT